MDRETAAKGVIGLTYDDAITYFKSLKSPKINYYLRPIKINNMVLLKDKSIDENRCNVVIEGGIIKGIDGWF
jgi:hypothetical protein